MKDKKKEEALQKEAAMKAKIERPEPDRLTGLLVGVGYCAQSSGPSPRFDPQTGKALYREDDEREFERVVRQLRNVIDGVPVDVAFRAVGRLSDEIGRQSCARTKAREA